jgi:hypothetical protein
MNVLRNKKRLTVKGKVFEGRDDYNYIVKKRALAQEEFSRWIEETLVELDPEHFSVDQFRESRLRREVAREGKQDTREPSVPSK